LLFDGVDDVASALDSNDDFDLGDALTLEAWVRVDVLQSGGAFIGGFTAGGGGAWLLGAGLSNPADAILGVSTPSTDSVFATNALVPGTSGRSSSRNTYRELEWRV
jgi:hypothetical protein